MLHHSQSFPLPHGTNSKLLRPNYAVGEIKNIRHGFLELSHDERRNGPVRLAGAMNNNDDKEDIMSRMDEKDIVFLGEDDLPEGLMEEIQSRRPPEWMVMKEVRASFTFCFVMFVALSCN